MSLPQVDWILYAPYLVLPGIFSADKNHRCCVGQRGIPSDLCFQIICTAITGSLESRKTTSVQGHGDQATLYLAEHAVIEGTMGTQSKKLVTVDSHAVRPSRKPLCRWIFSRHPSCLAQAPIYDDVILRQEMSIYDEMVPNQVTHLRGAPADAWKVTMQRRKEKPLIKCFPQARTASRAEINNFQSNIPYSDLLGLGLNILPRCPVENCERRRDQEFLLIEIPL